MVTLDRQATGDALALAVAAVAVVKFGYIPRMAFPSLLSVRHLEKVVPQLEAAIEATGESMAH